MKLGKKPGFYFAIKNRLILSTILALVLATQAFAPTVEATIEKAAIEEVESRRIEDYVREYFEDTPVMAEIAWCESRFRHFGKKGDVIRGEINNKDLGVMQINLYYHGDTAEKLGIDLHTVEGNMAYAKYLFEREGTTPWLSSSPCWGVENHIAKK